MHWLIHNKFDHDPKVRELVHNLERFDIPYHRASVLPFSVDDEIIFENAEDSIESLSQHKIFTYGSYTMANKASRLFKPGAYVSPNISMSKLLEHYKEEMLNHDMIVGAVSDIVTPSDMFFVRPVEDTKSIVGEVYTRSQFEDWQTRIIAMDMDSGLSYSTIRSTTEICVASVKQIDAEYRCFVVNGKVATASQYKLNGQLYKNPNVDQYIIDYVHAVIKDWKPDIAFVLDVALSHGKLYIIEANCINSSGLYEIDTQKLIMAVEELEYWGNHE
jgi:hypothetical protein